MSHRNARVYLIYLRPDGMLLSRKHYSDWHEIQDEYENYMTSVGPFSMDELVMFLSEQYGTDEGNWGFTQEEIQRFLESDTLVLEARWDN